MTKPKLSSLNILDLLIICIRNVRSKRPPLGIPRPYKEKDCAQSKRTQTKQNHRPCRSREDEYPTDERDQTRKRVQPHPIGPGQIRRTFSQQDKRENLADELHQNSG